MNTNLKDYFEMNNTELESKLLELKAEMFNLRFKHATNQLSNPMVLVEARKNIARAKTILRQRELGISVEPEGSKGKKKKK